ncbi:MAG: peptidylprolyl isomerase, partial [Actinomycetota bacterium]|nr:peptidylprolyl isomerase [Actinomycetota bacterium]
VVGPLRSDFGWHVAEVVAVQPATTLPLESVRKAIQADLYAAARGRRFDSWLEQRRRRLADVVPGYEHPGDPRVPGSIHRH